MSNLSKNLMTNRKIKIGDEVITAGNSNGITRGKIYKVISIRGSYIVIKNDFGKTVQQKRFSFLHADQYVIISIYKVFKIFDLL